MFIVSIVCHIIFRPLHRAAAKGRSSCVSLLLSRGASPLLRDGGGRTPAVLALLYGYHHCATGLMTHEMLRSNEWYVLL